jgi:Sap, sulfolipid-1-addressing protein
VRHRLSPVLAALGLIIPLGLAGAVSPVMLTEQTVLVAGTDGRRAGTRYAAGAVLTLLLITSAAATFGRAISLPSKPHLSATLDLILGAALLLVAALVRRSRRRIDAAPSPTSGEHAPHGTRAAFPFGVVSMATNFTTLALVVPAAKDIAAAGAGFPTRASLVVILVGLASAPAWIPVVIARSAPGVGLRALAGVGAFIARHGRTLTFAALVAAGVFFIGRGIGRLVG